MYVQKEEQHEQSKNEVWHITCVFLQSEKRCQPISPLNGFYCFSHIPRSNKWFSTSRICLTTTRSASPPLSVWLRTFWNCPTAAVTSYWGIWESTAWWSSTGPCTEMQASPPLPTKTTEAPPGSYVLYPPSRPASWVYTLMLKHEWRIFLSRSVYQLYFNFFKDHQVDHVNLSSC